MKVSDAKYAVGLNTRCSVLGDGGLTLNKQMPICTTWALLAITKLCPDRDFGALLLRKKNPRRIKEYEDKR